MSDKPIQVYDELTAIINSIEAAIKVTQNGIIEEKEVISALEDRINELIQLTGFLKDGPTAVSLEEFTLIKNDIKHFKSIRSDRLKILKELNQLLNEKNRELREVKKTAKKLEKKEKEGQLIAFKRKK